MQYPVFKSLNKQSKAKLGMSIVRIIETYYELVISGLCQCLLWSNAVLGIHRVHSRYVMRVCYTFGRLTSETDSHVNVCRLLFTNRCPWHFGRRFRRIAEVIRFIAGIITTHQLRGHVVYHSVCDVRLLLFCFEHRSISKFQIIIGFE